MTEVKQQPQGATGLQTPTEIVKVRVSGTLEHPRPEQFPKVIQEFEFPVPKGTQDFSELLTLMWSLIARVGGLYQKLSNTTGEFYPFPQFSRLEAEVVQTVGVNLTRP